MKAKNIKAKNVQMIHKLADRRNFTGGNKIKARTGEIS